MLFRMDKESKRVIKALKKDIEYKLQEKVVSVCLSSAKNNSTGKFCICFETEDSDTYTLLSFEDAFINIIDIFTKYMKNPDVCWVKKGEELTA